MRLLAVVALFALTGCNPAAERDRMTDIADDAAADAVAASPKLRDLESRLADVESQLEDAKSRLDALEDRDRFILQSLRDAHDGNAEDTRKIDLIIDNYNRHLRAYHGVQ